MTNSKPRFLPWRGGVFCLLPETFGLLKMEDVARNQKQIELNHFAVADTWLLLFDN
jgi:hypothetical protein